MTEEQLVLPGEWSGLLRRGSPVVVTNEKYPFGIITHAYSGDAAFAVLFPGTEFDGLGEHDEYWLRNLALDLADATGRAHAAWWLAKTCNQNWWAPGRLRRKVGGTTPKYVLRGQSRGWFAKRDAAASYVCPTLADLDPDDPRLLPDGSRLVDALALRRVCCHVAASKSPARATTTTEDAL